MGVFRHSPGYLLGVEAMCEQVCEHLCALTHAEHITGGVCVGEWAAKDFLWGLYFLHFAVISLVSSWEQ